MVTFRNRRRMASTLGFPQFLVCQKSATFWFQLSLVVIVPPSVISFYALQIFPANKRLVKINNEINWLVNSTCSKISVKIAKWYQLRSLWCVNYELWTQRIILVFIIVGFKKLIPCRVITSSARLSPFLLVRISFS